MLNGAEDNDLQYVNSNNNQLHGLNYPSAAVNILWVQYVNGHAINKRKNIGGSTTEGGGSTGWIVVSRGRDVVMLNQMHFSAGRWSGWEMIRMLDHRGQKPFMNKF